MESHILNTYHQARYRTIGHKIMRDKSDSLSSSESYNHNSPEYARLDAGQHVGFVARTPSEDSNGEEWCINQTMNTTQSSQDTTSDEDSSQEDVDDEENNLVVQEVNFDDVDVEIDDNSMGVQGIQRSHQNIQLADVNIDDSLVEGHDYDVITVYTVNPDLDLIEASSDDEKDQPDSINEKGGIDNVEYINSNSNQNYRVNYKPENAPDIRQQVMEILSRPIEPNVDDYLLKNKSFLDADGPVVKDVDEYFIKESDKMDEIPNVDDFFIKDKTVEEEKATVENGQFNLPESLPNVDDFLIKNIDKLKKEPQQEPVESENIVDVSINESDLEVLPKIEDLKRYLLEDMTYCVKFKNTQRSCSVPQSPMQSLLDIEDAKTCLSFEDLNLDLSDLAFDNDKDKSDSTNKSDDIPRTLTDEDINSFLITNKTEIKEPAKDEDDLSHQDMEIDNPVGSLIESTQVIDRSLTSTPLPTSKVLEFCIEKSSKKKVDPKLDADDFVDVEMCNDTVIPVLEANNLNSLLEQFEATEKMNLKKHGIKIEEKAKMNKNSLTNGMRLQDAGVQLNKNKMRQILMPSTINTTMRSPSPVHSDHDYCSTKKRHSLPNLKGGQSLLKPEVLSSNSRILNSRHRSCKDKRVVYHLSSDDESEKNDNNKNKKINNRVDESVIKKKIKEPVRPPAQSNCRKKLSPTHSVLNEFKDNDNSSVMIKSACKAAADLPSSQNTIGSIKLIIKNKSEVILNNCDLKDSQKHKPVEKCKSSVSAPDSDSTLNSVKVKHEKSKDVDVNKNKTVNNVETVRVKEEPCIKDENFYTTLFSNKQDVQLPQPVPTKPEKRLFEDELNKIAEDAIKKELEPPLRKKKLNLQEYKLRKGVNSNNSSGQVSPEAIFPDMASPLILSKIKFVTPQTSPNSAKDVDKVNNETPKKIFDPITEASRKILMNTKKQKAEAMRRRDEDIVMSKIPKVENLQLQPLISDAEMMKIVGMSATEIIPTPVVEKPQLPVDYEELTLVSVGTNTDDKVFKQLETQSAEVKRKSPQMDSKSLINFKIRKSDHVLKQNVFENMKRERRSPVDEKKQEAKIDKERFKDITATLKSVEKQVETKISSNSLFASIQDVVMKKAPDEVDKPRELKSMKQRSPEKRQSKVQNVKIVREYDTKAEHGEDKVILHLEKDRTKPQSTSVHIQTELIPKTSDSITKEKSRQRNDSDMSFSSESSPSKNKQMKVDERVPKQKAERTEKRVEPKDNRSRSKDRYDSKYRRRSRSLSRGRRRRHSLSRSRSRSRGRYRRYRRSDSPYKKKRRSRTPYHKRRSPSTRRDRHSSSRSRAEDRSKSPMAKKTKANNNPQTNVVDKKPVKSMTPPLRKPTVSESSESSTSSSLSTSSSSSSSSHSSTASRKSRTSCSPYKRDEPYRKKPHRSFSSEDRESNTPVEERRIVFVGRLEKDITKMSLKSQFSKFGQVVEVRLHSKEDGTRYGFVTYVRARDAWSAVEAASTFPQYDVGFGGRRAFCRQSYADLDGLEAKYTESAFHGQAAIPARRPDDMSFEQMLLDMKKKLSQRKNDKKRTDDGSKP